MTNLMDAAIVDENYRLKQKLQHKNNTNKKTTEEIRTIIRAFVQELRFHRISPNVDRTIENFLIDLLEQTEKLEIPETNDK